MAFVKRQIDVEFTLGDIKDVNGNIISSPTFDGKNNTLTVSGLRVICEVSKFGAPSADSCHLRVYGLTLSQMNLLTSVMRADAIMKNNSVTVSVGDEGYSKSVVFQGTITNGWANITGMPDAFLEVTAITGAYQRVAPVAPTGYQGPADIATIMSGFAVQMGLAFENNGVSATLTNAYFPGTLIDQVSAAAKAANIEYTIEANTLAIWPRGGNRGGLIPLIEPNSGLVGYPAYSGNGISVTTLYNPSIAYGKLVRVNSQIVSANKKWMVVALSYSLESEMPGGRWFTHFDGIISDVTAG